MSRILTLDQGTTSSRALLVDPSGNLSDTARQEFPQIFPRPGWVEHDPEAIWRSQLDTARRAARMDVTAIGITNQRETTILWNRKTGRPVANAIVWQDRRTAPLCEQLKAEGLEDVFTEKTGLIIDPYFSGTKVKWLLDHVDGAREQAERGELAFGTVDSWLVWNLTKGGAHITDVTNASRTLLFNIHEGRWDEELLAILEIPPSVLPEVTPSSGELAVADASWFGKSVPICGIAGDQQAALFGQACFRPGMIKNTYGTGCFLLMNTGNEPVASKHRLLTSPAWRIQPHGPDSSVFALEGSVFTGGSVVQWLRDGLGLIRQSADIEALAASVEDSGDVIFVPAFTGLGAPVWDASARGLVIGLTRGTTAGHLARAAVESIAFQVADVVDAMRKDAGTGLCEIRVDGGAAVNNALLQFQADIIGLPVTRPTETESTALGAAYLAGLGSGFWSSADEIAGLWKADRTFEPAMSEAQREEKMARWRKARDRAAGWDR